MATNDSHVANLDAGLATFGLHIYCNIRAQNQVYAKYIINSHEFVCELQFRAT